MRRSGIADRAVVLVSCWIFAAVVPAAAAGTLSPQQQFAREVYQQLLQINTTASVGDTHRAAQAMAARFKAAGFPDADIHVFETAPKRGNLVVRLRGRALRKPILLLAHLDVVEARPEDWTTDPFQLVEKDGYFYARGASDDKYMAATFVTNLIRYKQEGFRPDRDIIVALETDEESGDPSRYGIDWLVHNQRQLIDAEFAMNEGGGVGVKDGKPIYNSIQTSEKVFQSFWLEVHNPGGHSSQPRKDNAIYELAAGLGRLAKFDFPVQLNETTRLPAPVGDRAGTGERGHEGASRRAAGRGRCRATFGQDAVQRSNADHMRRDALGRRTRRQCFAAGRACDGQLPHSAGSSDRRNSGNAGEGVGG